MGNILTEIRRPTYAVIFQYIIASKNFFFLIARKRFLDPIGHNCGESTSDLFFMSTVAIRGGDDKVATADVFLNKSVKVNGDASSLSLSFSFSRLFIARRIRSRSFRH